MILADTSVWIAHLRNANLLLDDLLDREEIVSHPLVIGELAMGNLRRRAAMLTFLSGLAQSDVASHEEVLSFVERHQLHGLGLGYIDVSLLAGVMLTLDARLWSVERRLMAAAERFGVAYGEGSSS